MHYLNEIAFRRPAPKTIVHIVPDHIVTSDGKKIDKYGNDISKELSYRDQDTQAEKLIKNIKKNQQRLDREKIFLSSAKAGGDPVAIATCQEKIARYEYCIHKNTMLLKQRNAEKQKRDEREMTKMERRQKEENNEIIRLERSKIADLKEVHQADHVLNPARVLREAVASNTTNEEILSLVIREEAERKKRRITFINNVELAASKVKIKEKRREKDREKKIVRNYGLTTNYRAQVPPEDFALLTKRKKKEV